MKKILALLLALMLAMMGTAVADETAQGGPWKLTLTAVDADGAPVANASVHIVGMTDEFDKTATVEADGTYEIELDEGVYRVRVTDPADGYSVQKTVGLYEDTDLSLTIRKLVPGSEITVGTVSKVTGMFATDAFGNNTSDIDIRAMLHGYSTVAFTSEGTYTVDDSVVTLETAASDDLGNKTYIFKVKKGLTYNDGTPITAADYVFSVLMQASPAFAQVGGLSTAYSSLLGYEPYAAGERNYFSGVRLLDENTFSLTILTDYLPYYYELTYVNVTPYPISVLAPGASIADDGKGAYINGGLAADTLEATLINGYLSNPSVTSGPYELVSYDAAEGTVVMKANTNYAGAYDGARPLIEKVTLKVTTNADALDDIANGKFDIINKITDSEVVNAAAEKTAAGEIQSSNYLRSGLGFISFACEEGPTSSNHVRQAIAYLLDQPRFVADFTGTNGMEVYSWYGLGQWMVAGYLDKMDQELNTYAYDPDMAATILTKGGYSYNENGQTWKEGDGTRYRLMHGTELTNYQEAESHIIEAIKVGNMNLLPLKLRFAQVDNNRMNQLLVDELFPVLEANGFEIEIVPMSYTDMIAQYYRDTDRTCNMFALATNFNFVYDPYFSFLGDAEYQGHVNTTGIADGNLSKSALKLRSTTPGDEAVYLGRWLTLMKKYNEILPTVPLYSNVYYDFFDSDVQGYAPNSVWSWSSAILYTWIGEDDVDVAFN